MPSYISGSRLDVIKVRIEEVNLTTTDPRVQVLDETTNEFVNKPRPIAQGRDLQAYGLIIIDLTYSGIKPQVGEIWWCKRTGGRWVLDHIVTDELIERGSGGGGGGDGSTVRPNIPGNLVLGFNVYEKAADLEYTPYVTFNKVTYDENGDALDVSHYIINYRASTSSGVQQGEVREFIWAPNDNAIDPANDPNADANGIHYVVLPSTIPNPKTSYWQARIRAVRRSNTKGPWGDWTNPLLPTRASRPSPPYPQNIALEYTAMENATTLDYGVKVSFDDIGLWDIPGGDYQEDIQSYQVQVMAVKEATGTPPEEVRFISSDGTFYEIVDTPILRLTVNDSDDKTSETWQTLGSLSAAIDNNTDVVPITITDATAVLPLAIRVDDEKMYAYDTDISGNLLVYRQIEVTDEVGNTTTSIGTLKTSITATATNITVTETTAPSSTPFYIRIEDEVLQVTNRSASGSDFKYVVSRAQLSTTSVAHDSAESVSGITLVTNGEAQGHDSGATVEWLKNTKRYEALFGRVENPKTWYRVARVRTIDRYNRTGYWSPWTDPQFAPDITTVGPFPPAPTDVTTQIVQRSTNDPNSLYKVVVRFTDPAPNGWDIPGFDTVDDVSQFRVHLEPIVEDANGYLNYLSKTWKYPERNWGVLSANMDLTATTLTLKNAPNVTLAIPFYIRVENEIMLVTGKTSEFSYTVSRAHFETLPGVHDANSDVFLILSEPKRAVLSDLDEGDSYTYVALLDAGVSTTATQIRVKEPSNLPTTLPFNIKIGDEPFVVTENATASYQITEAEYALVGIQGTITFTTATDHLLMSGDAVTISGCGTGYDGLNRIVQSVTSNTFTIFVNSQPGAATIGESSLVTNTEGYIWTVIRDTTGSAVTHLEDDIVLAERVTLYTTSFDVDNVFAWTWRAKVLSVDRFGRTGLWSDWSQPVRLTQQDYELLAVTDIPTVSFSQYMSSTRGKTWLADVSFPEQHITTQDWQDKQNSIDYYEVVLATSNGTRFVSINNSTNKITLSEPNLPDSQLPLTTEDLTIIIGQETMQITSPVRTLNTTNNTYSSVYTIKARAFGASNNVSIQSATRSGTTATITTTNYLGSQYAVGANVTVADNTLIPNGVYTVSAVNDSNQLTLSGLPSSSSGPINEVQTITLAGFSGSDAYALAFGGTVSAPITVSAHNGSNTTAGSVRYALDQILGRGNWSTTLASSGTPSTSQAYTVTFQGALAGVDVGLFTAPLQDGCTVAIAQTSAGRGSGGSIGLSDASSVHAAGDLVWMRPTQVKNVAGFLDADQNSTVNAVFDSDISMGFYYRARFRIIDKFGRETRWSPWGPAASPSTSEGIGNQGPAAPINVELDVHATTFEVSWSPGETSSELAIPLKTIARSGGVVTATTYRPHEFRAKTTAPTGSEETDFPGDQVRITDLDGFNGDFFVTAVADEYSFSFSQSGSTVAVKPVDTGKVINLSDPPPPATDVSYYQVQTSKNDPDFTVEFFGWRNATNQLSHSNPYVAGTNVVFNIKKPGNFKRIRKLASAITATDKTITVTAIGTNVTLPNEPFIIKIEQEKMLVTKRSGNTWKVKRGRLGTTAAAHAENKLILYAVNWYTARVRAVDAQGNYSAWAYSEGQHDAPPQPNPPVVTFDKGSNKNRFRAIVTPSTYPPAGVTYDAEDINFFSVQLVSETFANAAQITKNTEREQRKIDGPDPEDEGDERAVFKNLRKDRYVFARIRAVDTEGLKSAWSDWTVGVKPSFRANIDPNLLEPRRVEISIEKPNVLRINWEDADELGNLVSDIAANAQSIAVDEASPITAPTVPFFIRINDEVMQVTTRNNGTYGVVRGQMETTAAAHDANAEVVLVDGDDSITKWLVRVYRQDTTTGASWSTSSVSYLDSSGATRSRNVISKVNLGANFTRVKKKVYETSLARYQIPNAHINKNHWVVIQALDDTNRRSYFGIRAGSDSSPVLPSSRRGKPKTPTGVATTFTIVEAQTRLRYQVNASWTAVTQTVNNNPVVIDKYGIQARAVNNNNDKITVMKGADGKPLLYRKTVDASALVDELSITKITRNNNAAPYTVTVTVDGSLTSYSNGASVKIEGNLLLEDGTYTITNLNTTNKTFVIASPVLLNEVDTIGVGGSVGLIDSNTDTLSATMGKALNPKKWFWQVRVRAKDEQGLWSAWSDWSAAAQPSGTAPKPPAPTIRSVEIDTVGKGRFSRYRLKVTLTPVPAWSVSAPDGTALQDEDDVSKYVVWVQVKPKNGSWGEKFKSKVVEDRDDDSETNLVVPFGRIHRGHVYRVRARSVDRFNRRGDWTDWKPSSGISVEETVAPVGKPNIERLGPRRIEWTWAESLDDEWARYKIYVQRSPNQSAWEDFKTATRAHPQFRLAVKDTDKYDTGSTYFRARVAVQTAPNSGGDAEDGRIESSPSPWSNVEFVEDFANAQSVNPVSQLQTPQGPSAGGNPTAAFSITSKIHTVQWYSPDNLTGFLRTRIIGYGANTTGDSATFSQVWSRTVEKAGTSANELRSVTPAWSDTEVGLYSYAYVTIQHLADPSATGDNARRDSQIWQSAPHITRANVTPPADGGGGNGGSNGGSNGGNGGSGGTGTAVPAPSSLALTWNSTAKNLKAEWTPPNNRSNIASYKIEIQGSLTSSSSTWNQNVINEDTLQDTTRVQYWYDTTAANRASFRYYRFRIMSIAVSGNSSITNSAWIVSPVVDSGVTPPAPPPPSAGPPTIAFPTNSASVRGGVASKIRLSTGISGAPNGNATLIGWVIRASGNSNESWPDQPGVAESSGVGHEHASGNIVTTPQSGSSAFYDISVPYENDGSDRSGGQLKQMYFVAYARTNDGAGWSAWSRSSQWTIASPQAPAGAPSGLVYLGANYHPHCFITFPASPTDLRYSGGNPNGDATDVCYYIYWQRAVGSPVAGAWNKFFVRVASALGVPSISDDVVWNGSSYTVRLPADGKLEEITIGNGSGASIFVKVTTAYIGNGGQDYPVTAPDIRGAESGSTSAVALTRAN